MKKKLFFFWWYILSLTIGLIPLPFWIQMQIADREAVILVNQEIQAHSPAFHSLDIILQETLLLRALGLLGAVTGLILLLAQSNARKSFGYGLLTAFLLTFLVVWIADGVISQLIPIPPLWQWHGVKTSP